MPQITAYTAATDVARAAAARTVDMLRQAIAERGEAVWVLAGGTSPMVAYQVIVDDYAAAVDWSRVTVIIGDERCVPFDDPACNWTQIAKVLFQSASLRNMHQLQPTSDQSPEVAAATYAASLAALPEDDSGSPILDVAWIGVGEDGHTLSLFPDHPDFDQDSSALVIPVHHSPKPPADRISLTLRAIAGTRHLILFATGAGKRDALARARAGEQLPVAIVSNTVEQRGGTVDWLFDSDALGE